MSARADRVNRVVLTLLGLLLLGLGVAGLLLGTGVLGLGYEEHYLLPRVEVATAYLVPGVLAAVAVVLLLGLRWLVLQLRTDRVGALDVTTDRADGETHVEAGALEDALEAAAEGVPGVESARARLVRPRGRERLELRVRVRDRADLHEVRSGLAAGPVAQVRTALGAACPELRVELEPATGKGARQRELV